jgi:NHL repeat
MKKLIITSISIAAIFISAFTIKQKLPVETWTVTTIAGYCPDEIVKDGTGGKACIKNAGPCAFDAAGNLFFMDGTILRKLTPDGKVTTLMAASWDYITDESGAKVSLVAQYGSGDFRGIVMDKNDNVIFPDRNKNSLFKLTADNKIVAVAASGNGGEDDGPALTAELDGPNGICQDKLGNIYIADGNNCKIRKLSADGKTLSTLAGSVCDEGLAMGSGNKAKFKQPWVIACDSKGNVYLAQQDVNSCIVKISATGMVTNFVGDFSSDKNKDATGKAAGFSLITAMCCDAQDNLYVAEDKRIRKVTPQGVVTTIAGVMDGNEHRNGNGMQARFTSIKGMCCDADGNIYAGDKWSIRKIAKQ